MGPLEQAAVDARARAHAPFSKFLVGAAIESLDGRVFIGGNIENSSYGLTVCAERVAVFSAIAAGVAPRTFRRLAVCAAPAKKPRTSKTEKPKLVPPCGACRQVLWDLCHDIPITLVGLDGRTETIKLAKLLPRAFDASLLP